MIDLIWTHAQSILTANRDVILELGLIQRGPRLEFCRKLRDGGHEPKLHVLEAPIEIRRERVRRRNNEKGATFSMVVPEHVFEMASRFWEAPDEVECDEFDVEFVEQSAI